MNLDADIAIKFLIKHMMNNNDDFYYMNEALKEAYKKNMMFLDMQK